MEIRIRPFVPEDTPAVNRIWIRVVEEGIAFPQTEPLDEDSGMEFFLEQSFTGIAEEESTGRILGLYILHPNNIGRCGHISNASYAVSTEARGQGVGEALVRHCLEKGRELGFRILQFNAVVADNHAALHLYEKLGFVRLGVIPGGFLKKDGTYQDIIPHYHVL